jgi:DNA-binding NarL/FixJ family response regulator
VVRRGRRKGRVLLVEDDLSMAAVIAAILSDERYDVIQARGQDLGSIQNEVYDARPDCVLLDGSSNREYGDSWMTAAWLARQVPPIPTMMLTAHSGAVAEARERLTERATSASFSAAIAKPFEMEVLIQTINTVLTTGDGHAPTRPRTGKPLSSRPSKTPARKQKPLTSRRSKITADRASGLSRRQTGKEAKPSGRRSASAPRAITRGPRDTRARRTR